MICKHAYLTLFPYTTLFRSGGWSVLALSSNRPGPSHRPCGPPNHRLRRDPPASGRQIGGRWEWNKRSEEHTSELQSLTNLVCRLLLEKKIMISVFSPVCCCS